jgi:ubiquinone biosynthesis protein
MLTRLIYILWIIAIYHLDEFLPKKYHWPFKVLRFFSWHRYKKSLPRADRLYEALEKLGPLFIKLGQIISTRSDLFPPDIVFALSKLQENVKPLPSKTIFTLIENTYQKPLPQLFSFISETPLGSASIAQVHEAHLLSGESVVLKIVRPDIKKPITEDLRLMKMLARLLLRFVTAAERFRPLGLIEEFEKTLTQEQDMEIEAGHAMLLKRNAAKIKFSYVPRIYPEWTRKNILVMEKIEGIRISDVAAIKAKGTNLKILSERGVTIFMTQVFVDNFFHADMHPGNVFVIVDDPNNPLYCAVDFGIMGCLTEADRYYLAQNLLGFFRRDYRRIARLHIKSGWVDKHTVEAELETAITLIFEPIFAKPLSEISFAHLLLELFAVAEKFKMEVQPQLLLFQKTLFMVEGLGRELYPELNLFDTVKPFLEKFVRENYGLWALLKRGLEKMFDE